MHLVLFDMDHTLIPADTGYQWVKFLNEKKLLSDDMVKQREQYFVDYQNGTLVVEDAYGFDISVLAGLHKHREHLLQEFFDERIKPIITQKALQAVQTHRDNGDYIVIITATLEEIARPIAEFFAVNHLIGGKAELDERGMYTGKLVLEPCMGRGKLVHLEAWLTESQFNPQEYTFYSDSHNDLPLLEQVDNPIAVDPDEKLHEIAKTNGWQIISFTD